MEFGFNSKTHKIEKMYDYKVLTYLFNYDDIVLDRELNQGLANLEAIMKYLIWQIDEDNIHIVLQLQNREELEMEDYLTIFSTFGIILSQRGVQNKQGYLNATDQLRVRMGGTNFAKVELLNHDYNFGIIQVTVEDEKGYIVKWVNSRE